MAPVQRPLKRLPFSRWKKPNQVKRFSFVLRGGSPIRVGGYWHGDVYIGKLAFDDGSRHSVAIKRFKQPFLRSPERIARYEQVIKDFVSAKLPFPKMGFVKLPAGTVIGSGRSRQVLGCDEFVLVSKFYGSKHKGTLLTSEHTEGIISHANKLETARLLTKIANIGYSPGWDIIEGFVDESRGVRIIDLDWVLDHGRPPANRRAYTLVQSIKDFSRPGNESEMRQYYSIALRLANPELKAELLKVVPQNFLPKQS